jgi:hypothetical protein
MFSLAITILSLRHHFHFDWLVIYYDYFIVTGLAPLPAADATIVCHWLPLRLTPLPLAA